MHPKCVHGPERVCPATETYDVSRHCRLCFLHDREHGVSRRAAGPCVHLGKLTGETRTCQSCGRRGEKIPLSKCEKYGVCYTDPGVLLPGVQRCGRACAGYEAAAARVEWLSTARLARDAADLAGLLPADLAGVVGVPRSGMIPAGIIAALLHLPLLELTTEGARPIGHGRGPIPPRGETLAVVDDTVYAGGALSRARAWMQGRKCVYAVVYATPAGISLVDYYARQILPPHILEWNLLNNPGWSLATDLDGVLTVDGTERPWMLPRACAVTLIATGRYESSRPHTEAWLRRWGVSWDRLAMLPDGEPQTTERIARHKGDAYAASAAHVFVESEADQAEIIHRRTGRCVVCPRAERVWPPAV